MIPSGILMNPAILETLVRVLKFANIDMNTYNLKLNYIVEEMKVKTHKHELTQIYHMVSCAHLIQLRKVGYSDVLWLKSQ